MELLKRTSNYVVSHTKEQAIKELKNDKRINKINGTLNKLVVVTNPIIPKGFKGDELFIYPVAEFKILINLSVKQLKNTIKITPDGSGIHAHMYQDGYCWGGFRLELLSMKEHKDWYWMVKRILDFLNDYGPERRAAPNGFSSEWVDRRLMMQLNYMKGNPKVKEKLKALNKIYRKKYRIYGTTVFR